MTISQSTMKVSDITMDGHTVLSVAIVAVSALFVVLKGIRQRLENKKPFSELPMAEGSHWLIGHANVVLGKDFRAEFKRIGEDSANEYGQTGFWLFGMRWVNVSSVNDARTVLQAEHERRPPMLMRHFNRHFIGDKNLLTINGKEWKFHRGGVARTFNPRFLNGSRTGMKEVAETMVASLKGKVGGSGKELDVEPLMKMITLDIFGKTALNTDFGLCSTLKPSPIVDAFEYILKGTFERLRAPYRPKNLFFWLPFEQNITHNKERNLIRSFVADLINEKRVSLEEDDKDLLSHLIRAHQDAPGGKVNQEIVSDEAMTDVLMTLLFAGYDTTSVTLTFALYLLAQNPEIQERLVEEIRSVKSVEDVEELVYCKAVVWEALRLYPAGIRTNRVLAKPVQLSGGFVAPEGSRINIPIWSIHRNPAYFPQPESFRPDRWTKQDGEKNQWVEREAGDEQDSSGESSIAAGDRKAMLAFSAGGRNCVGQKFAIQEAVIVLATLVKGLKFSSVPDYELEVTAKDLILKPLHGMPLKVEARA